MRDAYTRELAATVDQMFGSGQTDPSSDEIAREHFRRDVLGGEIIDGVQKRLRAICRILEEAFDHQVCLVGERYYLTTARRLSYREQAPETDAEARLCLPLGKGNRGIGIRLSVGDDDLIYQAAIGQGLASGGGKFKRGLERTYEATEAGHIPEERAAQIFQDAERAATPPHAAEIRQIRQRAALPRQQPRRRIRNPSTPPS